MHRFAFIALAVLGLPPTARAFSTESSVRDGCHERMTLAAIEAAGLPATPPPLSETERRIVADLGFELPGDAFDPWTVAMILGNVHVDLRGHERTDFVALAREAARAVRQPEHCLRRPDHDGERGNLQAIAACREWILGQVRLAIGREDTLDLQAKEAHEIVLEFRGPIEVELPRWAFRMGMALHALQDGFSHMLRTEDGLRVTHVLNYSEFVDGEGYSERTDGLRHLSSLDRCGSDEPQHQRDRVQHAAQASAELLAAVNDPTGGREGRLARVEAVLDRWFEFERGCTIENDYCDSPALDEFESGCAAPGTAPRGTPWAALAPLLAAAVLIARRRVRRALPPAICILVMSAVAPVDAQRGKQAAAPSGDDARETQPYNRGFGVRVGLSAGIDEEGGAVQLGGRYDVTDWLTLGLDVEYNPWFSLDTLESAPGTANGYATGIVTYGDLGPLEIRTSLHAGVSVLLWDMVGADRLSVGPFVGLTPLGAAFRVDERIRVTIDPGGVFLAVPNTQGVPLIHREHRFTVGLRVTP